MNDNHVMLRRVHVLACRALDQASSTPPIGGAASGPMTPLERSRVHVPASRDLALAAAVSSIDGAAAGSLTHQERSRLSHLPPRVLCSIERALSHLVPATRPTRSVAGRVPPTTRSVTAAALRPRPHRVPAVATSKRG